MYFDKIVCFLVTVCCVQSADLTPGVTELNCTTQTSITSPNYPGDYDRDANITWSLHAPSGQGIAIIFKEFNTEAFYDEVIVSDIEDPFNIETYSGGHKDYPLYFSSGSSIQVSFSSNTYYSVGRFNLLIRCFDVAERTSNIRVQNGASLRGLFEVLPRAGDSSSWVPVCPESWGMSVAERACKQLGFPGAYSHTTEGTDYSSPSCATLQCDETTVLLQDCVTTTTETSTQEAAPGSGIECFHPGFIGCFTLPSPIPPRVSAAARRFGECISLCVLERTDLAAVRWGECYCLNRSSAKIDTVPDMTRCGNLTEENWAYHFDVKLGVCDAPNEVENGTWSSNNVSLDSRLTLECHQGYEVNGTAAIACKPGTSVYQPSWDGDVASCQPFTEVTNGSVATPPHDKHASFLWTAIGIGIAITVIVIVIVLSVVILSLARRRKGQGWRIGRSDSNLRRIISISFNKRRTSSMKQPQLLGDVMVDVVTAKESASGDRPPDTPATHSTQAELHTQDIRGGSETEDEAKLSRGVQPADGSDEHSPAGPHHPPLPNRVGQPLRKPATPQDAEGGTMIPTTTTTTTTIGTGDKPRHPKYENALYTQPYKMGNRPLPHRPISMAEESVLSTNPTSIQPPRKAFTLGRGLDHSSAW